MSFDSKHETGCLYDREPSVKLNNVKFFRGDARLIRSEDFRKEQKKIDAQKRDGSANCDLKGPRTQKRNINFRDLVANL